MSAGFIAPLTGEEGNERVVLSIQSIMLITLGFLTATLLALTIAPAFWGRAVRLTTQRIKERLPVTETEIRADKDRLRAEFAMTVHRLEGKIEQAELRRARHLIDLNRRDANITQLENELTTLRAAVEEHENARRVLEHTVSERLPKVESRLIEARHLLAARDQEIKDLSTSTERQQQALEEARSMNSQQGAQIERLTTSLTIRGGRNKEALNDASVSGEIALRAEIDALRAKAREQAALIAKLQASETMGDKSGGAARQVSAAIVPIMPSDEGRAALERDLRALRSKAEDQASDIKMLTAELSALRNAEAANSPESKVALRARLAALQTQNEQQADLVKKLRAELAATNERLALQGAHFLEQMRRLGLSNGQTSDKPAEPAARISLAERVANSRTTPSAPPAPNADAGDHAGGDTDGASNGAGSPGKVAPRLIDRISNLSKV